MTEENEIGKAKNAVKGEGGNDGNAPVKKDAVMDSDDEDEMPLAISRAKLKKEQTPVLKENSGKKIGENSNSKPASKVKKETEDLKKKSVVKSTKPSKVKKEDSDDEKEMKKKTIKKVENKGKENKKSNPVKKERQKKSYDLPGQKHDPPEERDPLRIFYETLYHQIPTSEMAAIWMMERGLLAEAEAKRVFDKKRQKNGQLASPAKPVSTRKSPLVNGGNSKGKIVNSKDNKGKMVKKRQAGSDEDSDDDFITSPKSNANKKLKV